jgi:hypothetical protein
MHEKFINQIFYFLSKLLDVGIEHFCHIETKPRIFFSQKNWKYFGYLEGQTRMLHCSGCKIFSNVKQWKYIISLSERSFVKLALQYNTTKFSDTWESTGFI